MRQLKWYLSVEHHLKTLGVWATGKTWCLQRGGRRDEFVNWVLTIEPRIAHTISSAIKRHPKTSRMDGWIKMHQMFSININY